MVVTVRENFLQSKSPNNLLDVEDVDVNGVEPEIHSADLMFDSQAVNDVPGR